MRVGEKQKAFEWLEKAYEEHDSGLVSVAVEPMFEPIRSDPRFQGYRQAHEAFEVGSCLIASSSPTIMNVARLVRT